MPLMLASLPWRVILPVLGVLLALWGWGEHREGQGRAAERAKWEKAVAAEQAKVRAIEKRWQDEHSKADAADVARLAAQDALMAALQRKVTVYAQTPEGRACGLDAAGGLLVNEAIAAANRTVAGDPGARK